MSSIFKLGDVSASKPHRFADAVELLLLFEHYGEISKSDAAGIAAQSAPAIDDDEENDFNSDSSYENSAEENEKTQHKADACFRHFEYRSKAFGEAYPFIVERGILSGFPKINEDNMFYIFLLACSRLGSFARKDRVKLASLFEKISREAMCSMLPDSAEIRIFGANSSDRKNYYGSDFRKALQKLASDLQDPPNIVSINKEQISGDGGLDIAGYIQFMDGARGALAFFGQCTAQDEWHKKSLEAHPHKFKAWIQFTCDPLNILFIPFLDRDTSGGWIKDGHASGVVLIDRLRLWKLLKKSKLIPEVIELFNSEWLLMRK